VNPTTKLRAQRRISWVSDDLARHTFVIQQLWEEEIAGEVYSEWRDLPVVDEDEKPDGWR
jgi:hypothetical protein